jgi:cytochrome c
MFMWNKHTAGACLAGLLLAGLCAVAQAADSLNIGRAATADEIHAWDIDVRPDFKGLPPGSGTVERGNAIWDSTCAACHGSFAESNSVFTALAGGTTEEDIKAGHVASLTSKTQPVRTTFMKVDTISTLWDYIHRAMPWNAPKSLQPDDVYAVLAYLLNLADIVPEDFTLSDRNIAEVQKKMPNRDGMVFWTGLWTVNGKPDTHNTACMSDCVAQPKVSSTLPAYARNSNGNLAAQMRIVGPVRGADTLKPAMTGKVGQNAIQAEQEARSTLAMGAGSVAAAKVDAKALAGAQAGSMPAGTATIASAGAAAGAKDAAPQQIGARAFELLGANACLSCHAVDAKVLGPSFHDIAKKYKDQGNTLDKLVKKVRDGGSGAWGAIPMPPHPNLDEADSRLMLEWILAGAPGGK